MCTSVAETGVSVWWSNIRERERERRLGRFSSRPWCVLVWQRLVYLYGRAILEREREREKVGEI